MDIDKEVASLPNKLLQYRGRGLQALVDRVFTEDAKFTHPVCVFNDREEIYHLYHYWGIVNRHRVSFTVDQHAQSRDGSVAVLKGTTHICPLGPLAFRAWSPVVHLKLIVILHLEEGPIGKRIRHQEDHILWGESFAMNVPLLGPLYAATSHSWRRAVGLYVVAADELLQRGLELAGLVKDKERINSNSRAH